MQRITFTVEDLADPTRLERVLRQFQRAIQEVQQLGPPQVDIQTLAGQVAAMVKPQLEATGSNPLYAGNLLGQTKTP